MRRITVAALACLLLGASAGCMTSLTLIMPSKECSSESPFHRSKVYSGVRGWVWLTGEVVEGRQPFEWYSVLSVPFLLVDFPLSAVLDTLLLPLTLSLPPPE